MLIKWAPGVHIVHGIGACYSFSYVNDNTSGFSDLIWKQFQLICVICNRKVLYIIHQGLCCKYKYNKNSDIKSTWRVTNKSVSIYISSFCRTPSISNAMAKQFKFHIIDLCETMSTSVPCFIWWRIMLSSYVIICIVLFVWEIPEVSIVIKLQNKQCPLMIVVFHLLHAYVSGFNQKYI